MSSRWILLAKCMCRIAIGVVLLVYANQQNQASHALSDKAIGIEPIILQPQIPPSVADKPGSSSPTRRTVQPDDSEFFGIDPRELITASEKQKQQDAVKESKEVGKPPAPPKEKHRVQAWDAEFFGIDPREEIKKPEKQKQLQEAASIGEQAALLALAGGALIAWGFYPALREIGLWLFMPDWVRARMEAADKAEEHKESNHAGTCGTGIDGRGSGSNGVRDGEADRTVAEPPQTIANSDTAQRPDGPAAHVVDEGRPDARA